jgi:DNA-binding transcriptional MerR regulator
LIGASEAAGILGCDRSTISRFAKLGLLKPAVVEDGEVRWFDRKWIALLAAHFTLKRAARKRRARRTEETRNKSVFDANGDYRPELRERRPSRAEAMNPPPSKIPTRRSQTTETPKRDAHSVRRADRPTGARTQILPE